MDVVDLLDPVVLLQRDGVEAAHLAHRGERGLELAQRLDRRAGADELVLVEDDVLVDVLDRDDRVVEAAGGLGGRGALLRARGVGVDVVAGEPLDRGDEVGADALRDEGGVVVGLGVHRPGAAVGAHRDARHRLDAAGEDEVLPAGGDLLGGDVDGLQAGGAEAVELDAGDRVRQAGLDRGGLGDVGALVADGGDAPEDDVVDPVGVEALVAHEHLVHQADDQVDRLGRVQGAVALALAARGADGVEHQRLGGCHSLVLLKSNSGTGSYHRNIQS